MKFRVPIPEPEPDSDVMPLGSVEIGPIAHGPPSPTALHFSGAGPMVIGASGGSREAREKWATQAAVRRKGKPRERLVNPVVQGPSVPPTRSQLQKRQAQLAALRHGRGDDEPAHAADDPKDPRDWDRTLSFGEFSAQFQLDDATELRKAATTLAAHRTQLREAMAERGVATVKDGAPSVRKYIITACDECGYLGLGTRGARGARVGKWKCTRCSSSEFTDVEEVASG